MTKRYVCSYCGVRVSKKDLEGLCEVCWDVLRNNIYPFERKEWEDAVTLHQERLAKPGWKKYARKLLEEKK